MSKRATAALLIVGGLLGAALKHPEVRTVTVTEEVEVPGPTVVRSSPPEELPESCLTMIDRYLDQVDAIRDYSAAVGPQSMAFRHAAIAIHEEDIDLINAAITEQNGIENTATGPLQQVIMGQTDLDRMQARCEEERRN